MSLVLLIVLGVAGGLGAALRFLIDDLLRSRVGSSFPWATLFINFSGSFLLGVLLSTSVIDPLWVRILGTGFLGGYTTLSTASVDVVRLAMDRKPVRAAVYGLGGLTLILGAAAAGFWWGIRSDPRSHCDVRKPLAKPHPVHQNGNMFTKDQCYQAVRGRDTRFDGMFFTAVHSTGIFCRPSCPARTPLRRNVDFYLTAAAATEAGFRACKRCRPDASPGSPEWDVRADIAARAIRLIRDGLVDREGVAALAAAVGYSSRQLGRVMHAELGAGPLAIARNERARTARILIDSSSLTMSEIAFAAGFSSIRQFNDTVREVYGTTPSALRKGTGGRQQPGELVVRLAYRLPADFERLFTYLAARAVKGIEDAGNDHYIRSIPLAHGPAVISLRPGAGAYVECRLKLTDSRDLGSAVARARRILDLDADPEAVESTVSAGGLADLVRDFPGTRSPGHSDPVELAIRTVLGQQISVVAARTHLERLVSGYGRELRDDLKAGTVDRLFPTAEVIAGVPDADWSLPQKRIATIRTLASALAAGEIDLGPGCDREATSRALLELPGIGPWSVGYIRMRAMGDPDVYLGSDLGVKKAIASLDSHGAVDPARLDATMGACSPWRSYVTHLLWAHHSRFSS